jgi:hypothetical protein
VAVDDVSKIEKSLLSLVVVVCRTNLDRKYLEWKHIGAPETLEDMQPPFFVEGLSRHHTSKAGKVIAKIVKAKNKAQEKASKSIKRPSLPKRR